MNGAFSIWEERIAPVFDVATHMALVPRASKQVGHMTMVSIPGNGSTPIIVALMQWKVDSLVCGAISRPLHDAITQQGIIIYSFITGEIDEVIQAWQTDQLDNDRFIMPGCGQGRGGAQAGRRERSRHGHAIGRHMWDKSRKATAAPYGMHVIPRQAVCRCPRCGFETIHVPGTPCSTQTCPNCQAQLVRA